MTRTNKIILVGGYTLSVVLSVLLIVSTQTNKTLSGKLVAYQEVVSTQIASINRLEAQNGDLEGSLEVSQAYSDMVLGLGMWMEDKFLEIEAILIRNDENSTALIDWMSSTGMFYEEYSGESNVRYNLWKTTQNIEVEKYRVLKAEMEEMLKTVENALAVPAGTPASET